MVFSISFCSTDFGEKSFFIKWKCTPILEKVKKKLWRATIDCFTETEIGILLSKMLHKSVKYFFTWNQHTFLNNHINYNPSIYLSKKQDLGSFFTCKKQVLYFKYPNLVIVNEPVRPLLFTISNYSLYQIWQKHGKIIRSINLTLVETYHYL